MSNSILVRDVSGRLCSLPCVSPSAGSNCILVRDVSGRLCAIKASAPVGNCILARDVSGRLCAVSVGQQILLYVTTSTTTITRGVYFTLTVTAKDEHGNTITSETGTVTLSLSDTPDLSDLLDDNGTPLTTVTLTAGTWTSTKVAISGGKGADTCKIHAEASGLEEGDSSELTVTTPAPTLTKYWANNYGYGPFASWADSQADLDARAPGTWSYSPDDCAAALRHESSGANHWLTRGGWKCAGPLNDFEHLAIRCRVYFSIPNLGETVNVQLRYSTTVPTTAGAFRTTGTVLGTISIPDGTPIGTTYDVTGDAALAGATSELYLWLVLERDVDNTLAYGGTTDQYIFFKMDSPAFT